MQEQDIQAWEREIKHNQMMQKQREGWDGKKLPATTQPKVFKIIRTTTWGKDNEK